MMKKVIYGFTILLGIGLISTNFIINDTSNIDHKTVKAGGTACKWISESGYGYGPIYIKDSCKSTVTDTKISVSYDMNTFNMFECNNSTSGSKMDGNLIYNSDKTLYDGYFRFYRIFHTGSDTTYSIYVKVENGRLTYYGTDNKTTEIDKPISYNFNTTLMMSFDSFLADLTNYRHTIVDSILGYEPDVNNDGEVTYTCVCAEY